MEALASNYRSALCRKQRNERLTTEARVPGTRSRKRKETDYLTIANGLVIGAPGRDARGGAILNAAGASLTMKHSALIGSQVVARLTRS